MKTTTLEGVTPLDCDRALMSRLARRRDSLADGAVKLSFGIEGPDGDVYRIIHSNSLCESVGIFRQILDCGLISDKGRYAAGCRLHRVFRAI